MACKSIAVCSDPTKLRNKDGIHQTALRHARIFSVKRISPAVFGKPASYYENSRMIARARRPRVGRLIHIRQDTHLRAWVQDELWGKTGTIISVKHKYNDKYMIVQFSGTDRLGSRIALYPDDVEVFTLRSVIQARKAQERREVAEAGRVMNAFASFGRVWKGLSDHLFKTSETWARDFKHLYATNPSYPRL